MIFTKLIEFKNQYRLFSESATLVVALSGGPDSVFLLHYLHSLIPSLKLKLIGAHLNHQWRSTADRDEAFCADLCQKLGIPFVSTFLNEIALIKKYNGSKEEFARHKRRAFLEQVAKDYNADAIALGHHADDQIETFFIRLMRGATLTGLQGMKAKDGKYIRPLLAISKQEIVEYLKMHAIPYCSDETNEDKTFLRNNIRHTLIPAFTAVDPRASTTLLRAMEHFQKTEEFLAIMLEEAFNRCLKENMLNIKALQQEASFMQDKIILNWLIKNGVAFTPSTSLIQEIQRFIHNKKSKIHNIVPTWALKKEKGLLTIASN
jgi:tRNA(Ile)-lysidine synthase